jgi:hypothetical protein
MFSSHCFLPFEFHRLARLYVNWLEPFSDISCILYRVCTWKLCCWLCFLNFLLLLTISYSNSLLQLTYLICRINIWICKKVLLKISIPVCFYFHARLLDLIYEFSYSIHSQKDHVKKLLGKILLCGLIKRTWCEHDLQDSSRRQKKKIRVDVVIML